MKKLESFFQPYLKKRKIFTEAKASYILEKMKQILSDNLGEESLSFVQCKRFSEKKLYLSVSNITWKHEIIQHKKVFLQLLQAEFSTEEISHIIIV